MRTVLLTGVTGFIAKRIALDLLTAGYEVIGSVRDLTRTTEVRDAIRPHLPDPAMLDRLKFVSLDLSDDAGWDAAMADVHAVLHTASPFPMTAPKRDDDLIRPAVEGALRALGAAQRAGVTRVVLTSSAASILANDIRGRALTPDDWTDPDHPIASAYYKSKTLAERAAWEFVRTHPEMQLTAINPTLVLGAPLDAKYGTSLRLIARVFNGKDPVVPDLGFGIVDVADVSAMHLAALKRDESIGHRYIASAGEVTLPEMARYLKTQYPERKIATRVAPRWLLQALSLVDGTIKPILPALGDLPRFDTGRTTRDLGIEFIPWSIAVDRAAKAIASSGA